MWYLRVNIAGVHQHINIRGFSNQVLDQGAIVLDRTVREVELARVIVVALK